MIVIGEALHNFFSSSGPSEKHFQGLPYNNFSNNFYGYT